MASVKADISFGLTHRERVLIKAGLIKKARTSHFYVSKFIAPNQFAHVCKRGHRFFVNGLKYFMINLHERMLPTLAGIERRTCL